MVVTALGPNVRMDMVFRILPGPGNYKTIGVKASGVLQASGRAPGTWRRPGDGSFFGEYMASPGAVQQAAPIGSVWNQNTWNSARCDTAEQNLFPTGNNGAVVGLLAGLWAEHLPRERSQARDARDREVHLRHDRSRWRDQLDQHPL